MSNDTQVMDPELAKMLNGMDDDEPVSAPAHSEPVEPDLPVRSAVEPPVVAQAGDDARVPRPGMTPALEDLHKKREALIEASEVVLTTLNGTADQKGVAEIVRKMNAGLDGARVVLGSSFGTPKETLERLMEGHVIESITPKMFRDLLSGEAFQFPVLENLKAAVATMRKMHQAWCAACGVAAPDVQAYRASIRGEVGDSIIVRSWQVPPQFQKATYGDTALARDLRVLRAEIQALGAFAEAYAKALEGDWGAIETWIRDHKAPFAKAIAQADAAMAAAMLDEQQVVHQEPEPPVVGEPDVVAEVLPSDDDVILSALDLEDVDNVSAAMPAAPTSTPATSAATKPRDIGVLPSASTGAPTFVDRETGEIVEPTADEMEDSLLAMAEDARRASDAADAMPDDDLVDHDLSQVTRVSHTSDAIAPRRDDASGFNPVALVQKHFFPIAAGAAVVVLAMAFMIGHAHRKVPAPVAPPAPVVKAPAPAPAAPPVVVAPTPAVSPASTASAPAVAKPVVQKPVVAPAVPASAAPMSPPVSVKPAAAEHVAKPEVRKPARPAVHEHVTTMHETNQALDQLRTKLGE